LPGSKKEEANVQDGECAICKSCYNCQEKATNELKAKNDKLEFELSLKTLNFFFFYFTSASMVLINLIIWVRISS
jgi:hypothetical protein